MDFSTILNSPLPSKQKDDLYGESGDDMGIDPLFTEEELAKLGLMEESTDDDDFNIDSFGESDDEDEDFPDETEEGCSKEGCAKEDAYSSMYGDDVEIANELDAIMADDPDYPDDTGLDDAIDSEPDDFDDEDMDDDIPEPLEGPDDRKADNLMAMAATPMILRDELTAEESAQFYESEEGEIAISEGLILESELSELFEEGVFANPNKPFKLTKKARMRQLYELSVQIEARLHNDPIYSKLQKAYAIERKCKAALRQKYHPLALRRSKIYLKRLMNSKSGVLSKIGKKIGLKK